MCESQLLPVDGSRSASTFFVLDVVLTALFTVELLINICAHSNNGFQPFYSKGSNWFDAAIVLVSIANVIFTAYTNAKLLRLFRLGRAMRLLSALKDLQRLMTAISCAVVPVCNAFCFFS